MLYLISYDIEVNKTRTRLAKKLKGFGPRVQKSVFEADLNRKSEFEKMVKVLSDVELEDGDSIRLYRLCGECSGKAIIWGKGRITKDEDFYIL